MAFEVQIRRRLLAASGYLDLGLYQEAVDELESLPDELKGTCLALAIWLEIYQRWKKWPEAFSVAARLAEADPKEANWQIALAYAARRTQGLPAAREILVRACAEFPQCATIQFNLACYAAQLQDFSEARSRLDRAIALDRSFAALAKTDPDLIPLFNAEKS